MHPSDHLLQHWISHYYAKNEWAKETTRICAFSHPTLFREQLGGVLLHFDPTKLTHNTVWLTAEGVSPVLAKQLSTRDKKHYGVMAALQAHVR